MLHTSLQLLEPVVMIRHKKIKTGNKQMRKRRVFVCVCYPGSKSNLTGQRQDSTQLLRSAVGEEQSHAAPH